jgi:hypothetical protein
MKVQDFKSPTRKVYCDFDDEGVYVYQALNPSVLKFAVENGKFGKNYAVDRTIWIKPSFAWILHRTYAGAKNKMQAIARIKISHAAWLEILTESVQSHYDDEIYGDRMLWQIALKRAKVICQWDPERELDGKPLGRQSIQLGLKAPILKTFVSEYVLGVEDFSPLASNIAQLAKDGKMEFPAVPLEREYPIEPELAAQLGCVD